ncbi:heptaprenyl diphosphate synthase component 1 [Bacillus sp. N9]
MRAPAMTVLDHEQQIQLIKEMIAEKSYNSYFRKIIGSPKVDDDRILMMSIALQDVNITDSERLVYITSAMLVQLALDTHDMIATRQLLLKERQIMVLAGDYYSGLYYRLLAEYNHTELIKALAVAIKTINEHKILIREKINIP